MTEGGTPCNDITKTVFVSVNSAKQSQADAGSPRIAIQHRFFRNDFIVSSQPVCRYSSTQKR